jgi:hypothetical protein
VHKVGEAVEDNVQAEEKKNIVIWLQLLW